MLHHLPKNHSSPSSKKLPLLAATALAVVSLVPTQSNGQAHQIESHQAARSSNPRVAAISEELNALVTEMHNESNGLDSREKLDWYVRQMYDLQNKLTQSGLSGEAFQKKLYWYHRRFFNTMAVLISDALVNEIESENVQKLEWLVIACRNAKRSLAQNDELAAWSMAFFESYRPN